MAPSKSYRVNPPGRADRGTPARPEQVVYSADPQAVSVTFLLGRGAGRGRILGRLR